MKLPGTVLAALLALVVSAAGEASASMKKRAITSAFNLFLAFLASFGVDSEGAQNIVGTQSTFAFTANPVKLTDMEVSEFFFRLADPLGGFIDVSWCRGDFYFIEKCVCAPWADAGRSWRRL